MKKLCQLEQCLMTPSAHTKFHLPSSTNFREWMAHSIFTSGATSWWIKKLLELVEFPMTLNKCTKFQISSPSSLRESSAQSSDIQRTTVQLYVRGYTQW